jgi:hypothetical protein
VNALAKPAVGKYLNEHFVSSYQKVGTFKIVNKNKQGGNVASYFCTPDGLVLHAIAGPVNDATLLREARWVVETWKLAQIASADPRSAKFRTVFRKAHLERISLDTRIDLKRLSLPPIGPPPGALKALLNDQGVRDLNLDNEGRIHLLLGFYPLVRLEAIYPLVFERLLNEKLSTLPVAQQG